VSQLPAFILSRAAGREGSVGLMAGLGVHKAFTRAIVGVSVSAAQISVERSGSRKPKRAHPRHDPGLHRRTYGACGPVLVRLSRLDLPTQVSP
jgi:hypothetical protein